MKNPKQFQIYETSHWLINHRLDSTLPGYLMLGSKTAARDLCQLSKGALMSLGPLLAKAQNALNTSLKPNRIYIGRYGHTPGYPIHFHLIPIYEWVEELYQNDARYRVLQQFAEPSAGTNPDGAELTFFIWREFCEKSVPPPIESPSVSQTIDILRNAMRDSM